MSDDHSSSLALSVLGSGSGGNCSVIRTPAGLLLIDAGIGPRSTGRRLAEITRDRSVGLEDIAAVCLTHLDHDHCNPNWFQTYRKRAIRVFCHAGCSDDLLDRATGRGVAIDVRSFHEHQTFEPLPGVRVTAIGFAHDDTGSHGFVIDGYGSRIGYATDLGRVTDGLLDAFCDLDLLAIESNYDREMQMNSDRPWFLKQRIMSGRGHLSNAEAFGAVRELFRRCECAGKRLPRHVVLLHRSRDCNCPELLRELFKRDRRIASRLTLSEQHEPTPWLRAGGVMAGEQLGLFNSLAK